MFLGYFYERNLLVGVLNVYLRQEKVEEHRSGQGQVIKGQISYSYKYSHVIHVFMLFLRKEFITTGLKPVFHSFQFDLNNSWPKATCDLKFCVTVLNWCPARYWKFGGAARRRFLAVQEKHKGDQIAPPPNGARVKK